MTPPQGHPAAFEIGADTRSDDFINPLKTALPIWVMACEDYNTEMATVSKPNGLLGVSVLHQLDAAIQRQGANIIGNLRCGSLSRQSRRFRVRPAKV
jgi:hypothetical protein